MFIYFPRYDVFYEQSFLFTTQAGRKGHCSQGLIDMLSIFVTYQVFFIIFDVWKMMINNKVYNFSVK
jgi:hypothetical protein